MPDRHTHPPPTATLSSKTVHNRTRNRRHDTAQRHSEPDGRVKPRIYSTPRTPRSNRARPLRVAHLPAASFAPPSCLASRPVPALALGAAPVVWWSGAHTGAAGVGAGARTLLTLKWMTPKTPASRSTLSGSTPEGGAGCECGCPPHPAAHIGHTADAIPLPGNATTFPPPGGYLRRFSHARGRARACASSSFGFPTNLLSTHLQCP